ncbi:MAG: fibronectin type III domain-containing protein [Bacteroidia bacterium]
MVNKYIGKFLSIIAALGCLLLARNGSAQTTVTIGTSGFSDQFYPFPTGTGSCSIDYSYSGSEFLYVNGEGNTPVLPATSQSITSIAFHSVSSGAIPGVSIYLRNTASTSLGAENSTYNITNATFNTYTLVWSGSFPNASAGWNSVNLTTPFTYNGTTLDMIVVCNTTSALCTTPCYYMTYTGAAGRGRASYLTNEPTGSQFSTSGTNNMTVYDLSNGAGTSCPSSIGDARPDMEIGLIGVPNAFTASAITATTATLSWTAPASNPPATYDIYYSTSSTAPAIGTTPTFSAYSGTSKNLTGLTCGTTYYAWIRSTSATNICAWQALPSFTTSGCSTVTLGSNAPAAGTPCAGTTSVQLQDFSLAVTINAGNLTDVSFVTTGTYVAADISSFNLYYTTTNVFSTANLLATISSPAAAGTQTFPAFGSPTLNSGSTYYFWITANIAAGATYAHTIAVNGIAASNLTSTSTTAGGPTNAGGTQTFSTPAAVTVSSAGTYCGSTSLVATGGAGGTLYWENTSATGTSTASGTPQTVNTSGTYYYGAKSGAGCWTYSSATAVTINTIPAAVTVSTAGTYCTNTTLVPSGGAPGTLYWENTASNGTNTATTGNQTVTSSGTYYYGSDNAGCWTYGGAAVTINTAIAITSQPSTTVQNICQGGSATALSVSVTGTSPTYQWYSNAANSNIGGKLIAGATSSTYTPPTGTLGTTYYYCIISGAAPCGSVTSNVSGAIIINGYPAAVTVSTAGTYCTNTSLVATGGAGGTIYWENTTSNGTSTVLGGTPQTVSATGTYYYGSDNAGCWTYGNAAVTINTAVTITVQPSTTAQSGGTGFAATALSVTATGTGLTYQWYSNTVSSNSGGTLISGATSGSYTPVTTTVGTLYYYCVVSGAAPCGSVTSNVSGSVTVLPIPAAPVVDAATSIDCSSFIANWTASSGATSYYLDVSTSNTFSSFVTGYNNLLVGNNTSWYVGGLNASTIYYYRVRASNSNGTSGSSGTTTVTTLATASCSSNLTWQQVGGGSGGGINSGDPGNGDYEVAAICPDNVHNVLYIGGYFTQVNNSSSVAAACIASWTPNTTYPYTSGTWANIGNIGGGTRPASGDNASEVYAMAYYNGVLYIGGNFTTINGSSTDGSGHSYNNLAKYTIATATWSAVGGGGVSGGSRVGLAYNYGSGNTYGGGYPVQALAVDYSGDLYVGGNFTSVAGIGGFNNIAMWNGSAWSNLGGGITGSNNNNNGANGGNGFNNASYLGPTSPTVYALDVVDNTHVYAGGQFTSPGNNIAMWNGSNWTSSSVGTTGIPQNAYFNGDAGCSGIDVGYSYSLCPVVLSLANNGTLVYVGGIFSEAGSTSTDNLALWNQAASTWSSIGGVCLQTNDESEVTALSVNNGILYAGGDFQEVQTGTLYPGGIAAYDGWMELPDNAATAGFQSTVSCACGNNGASNPSNILSIAALSGFPTPGYSILFAGGDFSYTTTGNDVNNFAQYAGLAVPLPITLLSFDARYNPDNSVVDLNWVTATEINNKLFTVEKSMDGENWTFVTSVPGAGTSSTQLNYSTIDETPWQGTSYYRLKQTDNDGHYTYSGIRPVTIEEQLNKMAIVPNPASNNTSIIFGSTEVCMATLSVYDCVGRLIDNRQTPAEIGLNNIMLNVSGFGGGIYFVIVSMPQKQYTAKMIIER